MAIYTISDLHLSLNKEKPMDIFGENWTGHSEKIKSNWQKNVTKNDVVLMPGDFSWAMNLKETYDEFKYLEELPGKKILLKGNHDYWWETLTKMRKYIKENNFKTIDFGQTADESKLKLGSKYTMLYAYLHDTNKIKNFINKKLARFIEYKPITQEFKVFKED